MHNYSLHLFWVQYCDMMEQEVDFCFQVKWRGVVQFNGLYSVGDDLARNLNP